ncbi:MAG: hypothetical protein ABI456_18095 [Ktedonobacteraceae bacterium]
MQWRSEKSKKGVRQQDEGAAPATINRGLSTLRRLCTWAVEQRLLRENPAKEVPDVPSTPQHQDDPPLSGKPQPRPR